MPKELLPLLVISLLVFTGCNPRKNQSEPPRPTPAQLAQDSLTSVFHADYGFAITFPRSYFARIGWFENRRIDLLAADSVSVLEVTVHPLDIYRFDDIQEQLQADPDTIRIFAINRSKYHFYADGPDGTVYPRTDSVKEWRTSNNKRAFAVCQTRIEEYWGDALAQVPPHAEFTVGTTYWVDVSNRSKRLLLELKDPLSRPDPPDFVYLVTFVVNSVLTP